MAIELRQRSPLGACYRSPLAAFGAGAQQSAIVMSGTVRTSELRDITDALGDLAQAYYDSGANQGSTPASCGNYRQDGWGGTGPGFADAGVLEFDFPAWGSLDPALGTYLAWRIVGRASGAEIKLSDVIDRMVCTHTTGGAFPRTARTDWSNDVGPPPPQGDPWPMRSVTANSIANQPDGFVGYVINNAAAPAFTVGETVDAFSS